MDEWKVGDPADWGDHVGVPDIPYMGYLNDDDDEEPFDEDNGGYGIVGTEDNLLGEKARELYEEWEYEEALTQIDIALSKNKNNARNWKIKAKILCKLNEFEKSEKCFDKSLSLSPSEVVFGYKARMLLLWGYEYCDEGNFDKAMEMYEKATRLLREHDTNEDIESYKNLKLRIEVKIDLLEIYEKQKETLEEIGRENLILMAQCYACTKHGKKIKLVNEDDEIAIYIDEKKQGFVAKYDFTEENLVSIASELKLPDVSYAEYLFPYKDNHKIAKLLK